MSQIEIIRSHAYVSKRRIILFILLLFILMAYVGFYLYKKNNNTEQNVHIPNTSISLNIPKNWNTAKKSSTYGIETSVISEFSGTIISEDGNVTDIKNTNQSYLMITESVKSKPDINKVIIPKEYRPKNDNLIFYEEDDKYGVVNFIDGKVNGSLNTLNTLITITGAYISREDEIRLKNMVSSLTL